MSKRTPCIVLFVLSGLAPAQQADASPTEWRPLWNGRDLSGWTTTVRGHAPGRDPDRLVQVRDGAICMYLDVPDGQEVPFGIVTHDDSFSHFHLRFEYRWLGRRFPPRADALRDAGVLFHVVDISEVWPAGVECQVQEGDTGDLVWIHTGGLTWMHPDPDRAPKGQGQAGLLPEFGGVPRWFEPKWPYIGRFEEADSPSGWNRVELVVHGSERALHIVNGRTLVRMRDVVDVDGAPLGAGRISFQLEGAEIAYRGIEIRELGPPLRADRPVLAMSAVRGQPARPACVRIENPGPGPAVGVRIHGRDADAFTLVEGPNELAPGASADYVIAFELLRGADRYSAGLSVGDVAEGAFVVLQGIGLQRFEGENEPPLQRIVHALGAPLDVGGSELSLDTKADTIGAGVAASHFVAAGDGPVRITPLARFSPRGETPIGIFVDGDDTLRELAVLADSDAVPDAHQCLFPPTVAGEPIEFDAPDRPFGFYMKGHRFVSATERARSGSAAGIPHTARVWPVHTLQGRQRTDAWLIGFEEASNGDYQDGVLLVEGVRPR